MTSKILKSNDEWKRELSPELYHVAREKGTERPYTGTYTLEKRAGTYICACCSAPLFESAAKFDSGCGWPSFDRPLDSAAVESHTDLSHGMHRTEITCTACGAHLGHVFPDGPTETGDRYCINSISLKLEPKS